MNKTNINLIVESGTESKRIEALLRDLFPDISRAKWREEIKSGRVRVNGRLAKVGMTLSAGDSVLIEKSADISPGLRFLAEIQKNIVPIVYEDEEMFVFDKPSGMHSILQSEGDPPTLADYAVIHCEECLKSSPKLFDGGLVQRLDFYTSGLCIVAKSREVWESLHRQFTSHLVTKRYHAKVSKDIIRSSLENAVSEGVFIEASILKISDDYALVEVSLRDGSRHIVRRSFKDIGYPLIGDIQYGGVVGLDKENVGEFSLRCVRIDLKHPTSGSSLALKAKP